MSAMKRERRRSKRRSGRRGGGRINGVITASNKKNFFDRMNNVDEEAHDEKGHDSDVDFGPVRRKIVDDKRRCEIR